MYVPLSDLSVLCRLTGAAENAAGCIDKHCAVNLEKIFAEAQAGLAGGIEA
jgi:hypothetical protein